MRCINGVILFSVLFMNTSNSPVRASVHLGDAAGPIEASGARILAESLPDGCIVHIGTPESSRRVRSLAVDWKLEALGPEGFIVRSVTGEGPPETVIAASGAHGILYGCAALAEHIARGETIESIDLREKPVLAERNLWTWDGPRHDQHALFSLERMRNVENEPCYWQLGRYLAQARINTLTLWPDHRARPDVPNVDEATLEAYRRFTKYFREQFGVEIALFMWYEIKQGTPTPITGWPICPFDDRVIEYWRDRVTKLAENVPDLKGIVMAGAGGDWVRGPFECQCERCRKHTNRELIARAMRMIGEPWAHHGGRIIWKAVTDRPSLVRTEVANFANFDDELPPYVKIAHKPFYKDFRQPHPLHPMFFAHEDQRERVRPYLCEFQIYGEYRGSTSFPCVMIDRWSQIAPLTARKNYHGLIGVCSFNRHDAWDHPLNMANWYAFGRLAWNPETPPGAIYRDWAALTFGPDVADDVIEVCRMSYEAATKLMFFRGVMIQNHSKLPTIDYELESSLVGPWHHLPKNEDGYWGRGHDVSCYPADIAEQIRNDPALLLWAHRVPITAELCDEAIAQQHESVDIVRRMVDRWKAIPHDAWRDDHADMAERLSRNLVDAEVWCECLTLYFDYKAGRLTRDDLQSRLDRIRRFDPDRGTDLIRHTFDRFFEEWQRVLDGNLIRRSMEGDYHNPEGEPFLPGLAE